MAAEEATRLARSQAEASRTAAKHATAARDAAAAQADESKRMAASAEHRMRDMERAMTTLSAELSSARQETVLARQDAAAAKAAASNAAMQCSAAQRDMEQAEEALRVCRAARAQDAAAAATALADARAAGAASEAQLQALLRRQVSHGAAPGPFPGHASAPHLDSSSAAPSSEAHRVDSLLAGATDAALSLRDGVSSALARAAAAEAELAAMRAQLTAASSAASGAAAQAQQVALQATSCAADAEAATAAARRELAAVQAACVGQIAQLKDQLEEASRQLSQAQLAHDSASRRASHAHMDAASERAAALEAMDVAGTHYLASPDAVLHHRVITALLLLTCDLDKHPALAHAARDCVAAHAQLLAAENEQDACGCANVYVSPAQRASLADRVTHASDAWMAGQVAVYGAVTHSMRVEAAEVLTQILEAMAEELGAAGLSDVQPALAAAGAGEAWAHACVAHRDAQRDLLLAWLHQLHLTGDTAQRAAHKRGRRE